MRRAFFARWALLALAASFPAVCFAARGEGRFPKDPVALLKDRPRLLADAAAWERLRRRLLEPGPLADRFKELKRYAGRGIGGSPVGYSRGRRGHILRKANKARERIFALALLARLEKTEGHRKRLWKELRAAGRLKDWNPRHFLDAATLTAAFAVAYDWLYDEWDIDQRRSIRHAIVEKGLKPALKAYDSRGREGHWVRKDNNWNLVCNAGMIMGALAVADEEPELSREILRKALESVRGGFLSYGPDGGWIEGPGYWNYGNVAAVALLSSLKAGLGSDFGLSDYPGFRKTGFFPIYMTGPTGAPFNFADGRETPLHAPQLRWLARRFHEPAFSWWLETSDRWSPLDFLWYVEPGKRAFGGLPLGRRFRDVEAVSLRSAWGSRGATFVGFKAGKNGRPHGQLDIGTFVLEALGRRWIVDLGPDEYSLPGYFRNKRWTYYRCRAEGHNTLTINPGKGSDQVPNAETRIIDFSAQPSRMFAVADLSPAYAGKARSVKRGVAVIGRRSVLVQDEIKARRPVEVVWAVHTRAKVSLADDGHEAVLKMGRERLLARILHPGRAVFEVVSAAPATSSPHPEGQDSNRGVRKLMIRLKDVGGERIAVYFIPYKKGERPEGGRPLTTPLKSW